MKTDQERDSADIRTIINDLMENPTEDEVNACCTRLENCLASARAESASKGCADMVYKLPTTSRERLWQDMADAMDTILTIPKEDES